MKIINGRVSIERLRSMSGLASGLTVTDEDGSDLHLSRDVLAHIISVLEVDIACSLKKRPGDVTIPEMYEFLCTCAKPEKKGA